MLEGLAAWVLNNYLGKYVENLNTDQLSIALLSGKVELENLPLKKDALRNLGLPVEIKAGFIGKIKLQIPVRQIRSAPWVIVIEQLYLVASPLPVNDWDSISEELSRHEFKLSALDTVEAKWRLEVDSKDNNPTYYASSYSSWLNFGTGVISDIVENIQLKIQDVHIRYEDNISVPDKAVVFGITVDSLSAESCDSNWIPGFSHWDKMGESFKLLEMQKFSIYWMDLDEKELLSNLSLGDLAVKMSPTYTLKHTRHYILPPVSAQAHIKRNRSEQPLRSMDTPRIVCDLLLEEVPLTLIDWQYDQIVKCVRGLDDIATFRSYRRYKPSCSVREDARAWWLYAISCFYPGKQPAICRPRPTWELSLCRAKQNVQYVKIYSKILVTPTISISPDEKKLKDEVEWDREFDELKILRQLAMRNITLPNRTNNNSAGRSMLENWFPQWMGWYSSSNVEVIPPSPEATQLEGEILQVLTDSAENNTILKRDVVFGKFNFCLKRGCISLCTATNDADESATMLELEFKNLSLDVLSKPRTSSHIIELALGSLHLKDKITLNSLFPILMGPPGSERTYLTRSRGPQSPRVSVVSKMEETNEHLFYLAYEKKPPNSFTDYGLRIRSKCLDVIYQPNAIRWLTEFLCLPHQKNITQSKIEAMKNRTKKEFIKNWEQILDGRGVNRTIWDFQFDISAPQIIFVEQFSEQNSAMAVIDFGRLQLRNNPENTISTEIPDLISKASEEDETFLTPCSTPPQSEASISEDTTLDISSNIEPLPKDGLNEASLHKILYDRYCIELTDLQILIGKVKDNWRFAQNKGSSTLHVLDRFNILIQVERRIIHTVDPLYPSLTFNANLPKLVAHLNETKMISARNLLDIITTTGLPSPFQTPDNADDIVIETGQDDEQSSSMDTSIAMSRLLMVQFTVDQLSLEVQSRGRSVAELQVSGVKVAFVKRSVDMNVTLTVHSLLLVDALQTFGPDFELLVASHKHVGMDSMSGSLRDSEPTSPMSPASPDPSMARPCVTSPVALTQALSSLVTSAPLGIDGTLRTSTILDAEALITIEVILVTGLDPMQLANIQFNNLDIIANQETIVELMGLIRRVFPKSQKQSGINLKGVIPSSMRQSTESLSEITPSKIGTTELVFDFHRLNILLLRGVVRDGMLYGKKICTATMTEAKIQATVSSKIEIEGSLGGLQVLDLTPEGHMHQRIVSVGKDPLLDDVHLLYTMSAHQEERTAFSFRVVRSLEPTNSKDIADITVRMGSLWYTHSPQFVIELQSCATEFKQYLANLARSIRTAATDMALGLVHARTEALAQSLYMNARLSSSIYGSALSFTSESASPRKRRRSSSVGLSGYSSARDTVLPTPYSPEDDDDLMIDLKLNIELDSPVVILPRANDSCEVFVAHLGKINVTNKYADEKHVIDFHEEYSESRIEYYDIEVRDMNLFSLDISSRRVPGPTNMKPEVLYNCKTLAKPILHDTIIQLYIEREMCKAVYSRHVSETNLLMDDDEHSINYGATENIQLTGTVVTALKVSLTKMQYEQLLDTLQWLTSSPKLPESQGSLRNNMKLQSPLTDISEEDTGVTTLNMDPHVRAKLFPTVTSFTKSKQVSQKPINFKVAFELPVFTIELRGNVPSGEQGLIDLSFRDFIFNYEKCHKYETNVQVSLRSIFMEDLLQPEDSKQRAMMVSSSGNEPPPGATWVSRSCPDITYNLRFADQFCGSLPDHLETSRIYGTNPCNANDQTRSEQSRCPCTPPPSPSPGKARAERNLVLISILMVDPETPDFDSRYNSIQRSTSIDFNCLDLVINVESWIVMIDFFSATPSNSELSSNISALVSENAVTVSTVVQNVETNVSIRSLTMVLVKADSDIAKANISNIDVGIKTVGLQTEICGKLGSMSLLDLTLRGNMYRERFWTAGKQALQFKYVRHPPDELLNYDVQLNLEMSSVIYVHTKRFVAELQAFFNHFSQLQSVMRSIRAATSGQTIKDEPLKVGLVIQAVSPMIILPVSSKCSDLLVVDLGELLVKNTFKLSGDEGTISIVSDTSEDKCLLDVMSIELQNMDLYTGVKENDFEYSTSSPSSFKLGSSRISKIGQSLLTEKFHLRLQVERNLSNNIIRHCVPDMSIYGHLSTLDATLDISQYRLIRGLLAFNLGEDTERISPSVDTSSGESGAYITDNWILSSLKFDLQNVTLRLQKTHDTAPITCINFIKSRLTVETFSNLSQDIDLVSQEILLLDTRFDNAPTSQQSNVFINILQPLQTTQEKNVVQAEIHSRKRQDHVKFTVLLNSMRLMAVFDWWEAIKEYIFQNIENVPASPEHQQVSSSSKKTDPTTFEAKLNITDSEIVVVENTSQWDTNAVILKSTTVINFKPSHKEKPLSCSLNHCEMFSCVLGMEDDTALSIIDPVTLNIDINEGQKLEAQLQFLTVRFSYHDMKMFLQILKSLPMQMLSNKEAEQKQSSIVKSQVKKLVTLGFKTEDCIMALEKTDNKLDDAAIWLTKYAIPQILQSEDDSIFNIKSFELKANCISVCIIDDCGDSDVPLLEFSLGDLSFVQDLTEGNINDPLHKSGSISTVLSSDYYNRILSGWEPILEPWNCRIGWYKSLSADLLKNRLNLKIHSDQTLNLNITSNLLELYKQVKENWMKDYYNVKESETNQKQNVQSPGYRQRSPFIPFALKNETGSLLHFNTLISEINKTVTVEYNSEDSWITVSPGDTVPFSFRNRGGKMRHQDSHKMKMHQLAVRVEGWEELPPVTVDKVGVYFRHAAVQFEHHNRFNTEVPSGRIVFDVALEGSARKLVTIRSALILKNKLSQKVEVKLESQLPTNEASSRVAAKVLFIEANKTLAIPLQYAHSQINIRPSEDSLKYTYCCTPISWRQQTSDLSYDLRTCHSHKGDNYRFCVEIVKEKGAFNRSHRSDHPAHTITLLPTVKIVNLLPIELHFQITGERGRIFAGCSSALTTVDPDKVIELQVILENFSSNSSVIIPAACATDFECRIRLEDVSGRKLYLQAVISLNKGAKIKIVVSALFWIFNKTGLPLVFRQAGTSNECAGQFDEHEVARMITPLLFSFSDQDGSPTINARVGHHVIRDGKPQWSSNFHVQKGIQVRKLRITVRDGRPDTVFVVGIEVRPGRGKYRSTNIVTISPRYQLYNRSSYKLAFSQSYFTKTKNDSSSQATCLKAMPQSHMAFHWPRLDQEQLLCVSILDIADCVWSGGLQIDTNNSIHVNVRDSNGRVYFLRLEVVLQGATFFVVFTDADRMPPPIRVDNFSEIAVIFAQTCYKEIQHSTARAHSSVPYAWDQPTQPPTLICTAPGGVPTIYDMSKLGKANNITYENFIYIAFVGTFKHDVLDPLNIESQELVLDVINVNQVVLARKQRGQRSQLWRMTVSGQLQHEGSSPPSRANQPRSDNMLVLDIENTAPQPNTFSRLILRKVDGRRKSTQTWRFTNDGRLSCAHHNMCVQAQDGFFGLRKGNSVVLGLIHSNSRKFTDKGVPIEQAIGRQKLRPGSGILSTEIVMDGPTRVLIIKDMKASTIYATPDERDWGTISLRPTFNYDEDKKTDRREMQFTVHLNEMGISLVSRSDPEELLYASFVKIVGEVSFTQTSKNFSITIGHVQVDNQVFEATAPVVLYVTPPNYRKKDDADESLPAIMFQAEMQQQINENAVIFQYFILRLNKMTVILEELLLLKLFSFLGFHSQEEELLGKDENDHETQRLLTEVSAVHLKRYYFGVIQLIPSQIILSVKRATKLSTHLQRMKKKLGLTLIRFEDAAVDLQAFKREHPFETIQFLINSIIKHFKDELKWQAGIILGSVDFLGNPIGLMNDVSDGLSNFIKEGNIGSLVKNVTHGISNSAAKVTETLSDGLGIVGMDDQHEEVRQKIRQVDSGRGRDHIVAGFKGLGFGLLGGATSIFEQVYKGAASDGIQGVFSGIGKGVMGTVTKPVMGVLDFASEAARAVRDSSSSKVIFEKRRLTRCVHGYGGLLPRYSFRQSRGQQNLYRVNGRDYTEQLIAYEVLGSASEDLQCIISNERIRIVGSNHLPDLTTIVDCHFGGLISCEVIEENEHSETRYYIEIVMHAAGTSSAALVNPDPIKKPKVRCGNRNLACSVAHQINYARRLYTEYLYTLITDNTSTHED